MASEPASPLTTGVSQRGPTSGVHRAATPPKPPLLASEELRNDAAPLEPERRAARWWLLAIAALMAGAGVAFRAGLGVPEVRLDAAAIAFSAAGATAALGLLPFPYALRAGTALVVGAALMTLGLRGAGPLAGIAVDGGSARDVARFVALTALPAALLFRSRYRIYRRGAWVLAGAILLAVPFIAMQTASVLTPSGPLVARAGHVASIVAVGCTLFGFLGGGRIWAGVVVLVLSAELAVRELTPLAGADTGTLTYPITAATVACAAALATLGAYQLLAAWLAPDARKVPAERGNRAE